MTNKAYGIPVPRGGGEGVAASPPGSQASPEAAEASSPSVSIPNAARAKAEQEAAKRERHKGKHMTHKRWAAVHTSTKGWHVALVDNQPHIEATARERARRLLLAGNFEGFMEAAGEALMARVRLAIDANPAASAAAARSAETEGLGPEAGRAASEAGDAPTLPPSEEP